MPTIIGLIFFFVSIYFFFRKDDALFSLVIISSIFMASSVVASKTHGIAPYYMVALIFILQCACRKRFTLGCSPSFRGKRWVLLFATIGILSAFILPVVFAGIPVYDPYVGIDDGLFIRPPLRFGLANVTQSVYLLLDVLVVIGAAQCNRLGCLSRKAYMFTFYLLTGIILLQFTCSLLGINFPYALLQTHGGSAFQGVQAGEMSSRYPGTFTESSAAGLVLVTFTSGFLAEKLKYNRSLFPALVGLFTILLVRSTGALVVIAIIVVSLIIAHPIIVFPFINIQRLRRCSLLIFIVAMVAIVAAFSSLNASLITSTIGKQESSSFINRTASDAYAVELFIKTKGIGVGMGSNRPSSLFASLLSTVGVTGLVVFMLTYFKILTNASNEDAWVYWAGLALFLDSGISCPDYITPWIWVFLAFVVQIGKLSDKNIFQPGELQQVLDSASVNE